ncbi:MAG: YkgJ family cysteine cluster protein [Candidatus Jordarchaeaceae archaeon]
MTEKVRFKCVRCGNCCRDETFIITITHKDVIRLADHLKCNLKDLLSKYISFYQVRKELENRLVFPAILTYRGNAFLGLRKKNNGSCVFLREDNLCEIYAARPMVCRSFPFTFSVKDGWLSWGLMVKAEEICPGLGQGETFSKESLESMAKEVIGELEEYKKIVSIWNSHARVEQLDPILLLATFF